MGFGLRAEPSGVFGDFDGFFLMLGCIPFVL